MTLKSDHPYLNKDILLEIYEEFKLNPLRIYVANDFGLKIYDKRIYLNVLVKLNLIEEIEECYTQISFARKRIIGYRLKRHNETIN